MTALRIAVLLFCALGFVLLCARLSADETERACIKAGYPLAECAKLRAGRVQP